jgi:hypothetical protein
MDLVVSSVTAVGVQLRADFWERSVKWVWVLSVVG